MMNSIKKIYEKITKPQVVRLSTTIALIVAASCIIIGVIVAMVGPPGGYNLIDNYISDLGGSPYTPFPYFLDIAAIVSGVLLISTIFYMEKILVPRPEKEELKQEFSQSRKMLVYIWIIWMLIILIAYILITILYDMNIITDVQAFTGYAQIYPIILWLTGLSLLILPVSNIEGLSKMRTRLGNVAFMWICVGIMGWFFVGVFSEDRTTHYELHFWASILCFSGLALGGFFFGLVIAFYDTIFPKVLGYYTFIVPTMMCIILIASRYPLVEWLFFFSVFGWMIPGFILLVKHLKTLV